MKAVVVHAPGDIRYEDLPRPRPGRGEALAKVKAAGICSSDLPRALGDAAYFYPIVLGHEVAGEVSELGKGVKSLRVGERVAVAPLIPCRRCEWCQRGRYSLCDDYNYLGSRTHGGYAEYVAVPVENLVPLPPAVDCEAGAMLEPTAVVLHGLGTAGVMPGDDVAVIGAGPLGLLAIQLARALGAGRVFAVDLVNARLEVAESLDAQSYLGEGATEALTEITLGRGVDLVVETAGTAKAQESCLDLVRKGGRVLYQGIPEREVKLSQSAMRRLVREELTIYGAWNSYSAPFPGYEWHASLAYMASGQLQTKPLITHRFTLQEAREAFMMMHRGKEFFNKVMLTEGGEDEVQG
jgi:L-iditol 2-dehydrogenase